METRGFRAYVADGHIFVRRDKLVDGNWQAQHLVLAGATDDEAEPEWRDHQGVERMTPFLHLSHQTSAFRACGDCSYGHD
jgi:hypothetical protein